MIRIPVKTAAMTFDTEGLNPSKPPLKRPVPLVTLTRVSTVAWNDISDALAVVRSAIVFTNEELCVELLETVANVLKTVLAVELVTLASVLVNTEPSVAFAVMLIRLFVSKLLCVVFAVMLARVLINKGFIVVFNVLLANVLTTCRAFPVAFTVMLTMLFVLVNKEFDVMLLVAREEYSVELMVMDTFPQSSPC